MTEYQHRQKGTLIQIAVGAALTLCLTLGIQGFIFANQTAATISFVVAVIMAFALFLFGSLTVTVTDSNIKVAFGIGLIRFNFDPSEIETTEKVRNRWVHGWGIRWYPGGWLYNVSGFHAIEIKMKNGKNYRIGTDEPDRLHDAILTAMNANKQPARQ